MNTQQKITLTLLTVAVFFAGITTCILAKAAEQEFFYGINLIGKALTPGLITLTTLAGSFISWTRS